MRHKFEKFRQIDQSQTKNKKYNELLVGNNEKFWRDSS